ncbi:MAG: right-handed parallel beta-helix repeat-containing protein, partial [bacterium]
TNPVIRRNIFTNNGNNLAVSPLGGFPIIVPPFYLRTSSGLENNNTYDGSLSRRNKVNGIGVYPGTIDTSLPVGVWGVLNSFDTGTLIPYVPLGLISIANNAELRLQEGVIVKFYDPSLSGPSTPSGFTLDGIITSLGTGLNPIVLTSFKDDSYGGDTNGDGGTALPSAGDWGSVLIRTRISGTLAHVLVRYGGNGAVPSGAVIFQGPSQVNSLFTFLSSIVEFSLGPGVVGQTNFNLEISESIVRNNGAAGISITNSPISVKKTEVNNNINKGIVVNSNVQVNLDSVNVHNNTGNGVDITGSRPTVVNSFQNPVFPHIIRNNSGMGMFIHNPDQYTIDDLTVSANGSHGIFVQVDTGTGTQVPGQVTDSLSSGNTGAGLRIRNDSTAGFLIGILVPTVNNFVAANNTGPGVEIYHASPTIQKVSLVNNHGNGLVIGMNTQSVVTDVGDPEIPGGGNASFLSSNSEIFLRATEPEIGLRNPTGPFPGACPTVLPVFSNYNCYSDNDPWQIEMPPHITLNVGNFFQPTPFANPLAKTGVKVTRGVIYNKGATFEQIDPNDVNTYITVGADTIWRPFSTNVVYHIADDVLVLPENYSSIFIYPNHPNDEDPQTRVFWNIGATVLKFATKPENPAWSRERVDVHIHSVLQTGGSVFTSFNDDTLRANGDTGRDGVSTTPLAGDWGGLQFHEDSRDWYDSMASGDADNDPTPCAWSPYVDPMLCPLPDGAYDPFSQVLNTKVLYGGGSPGRPGSVYLDRSSPYIHASVAGGTEISFSATNGLYANGQDLNIQTPCLGIVAVEQGYDWTLCGSWPFGILQNYAAPLINNTLFQSNANYGAFFENGSILLNVDGDRNFAGSNTYTGNGHDCIFVEGAVPACP